MVEIYNLMFDISFIYTLPGFWFCYLSGYELSMECFLMLSATVLIDVLLRRTGLPKAVRLTGLAVPAAALLFDPGLPQLIFMAVSWLYLAISITLDRVETDNVAFRRKTMICMRIMPLMAFGFLVPSKGAAALELTVPYFIIMLYSMIWLLRMLRIPVISTKRQIISSAAFFAVALLSTLGRLPELIVLAAKFAYDHFFSYVIEGMSYGLGTVLYGIGWLFKKLFVPKGVAELETEATMENGGQVHGLEELLDQSPGDSAFWGVVWKIVVILLIIAGVVILVRFLLGKRRTAPEEDAYTEKVSKASGETRKKLRAPMFRPFNPREAVRYDYVRFMRELNKRGVGIGGDLTTGEIAERSSREFFAEDLEEFRQIYCLARYAPDNRITRDLSSRSAELLRKLKGTSFADVEAKNEKK